MRRANLWVGAVFVAVIAAMAVVSVFWTPFDPTTVQASNRLRPPGLPHLMGTDGFGIDIFSRILIGSRTCLLVGVVSVAIGAAIGVPLGMIAGISRKWPGRAIMRATDILYAFPAVLLAILLAAAHGRGSVGTAMVAIGIATVPTFVRVTRGATLQVMSQEYIVAARSCGIPRLAVALTHVLPNVSPVVLVQTSMSMGMAILSEAALSYLGLSAPSTTPTWGRMLHDAQKYLFNDPNQALWPGVFIALAVLGFNLLGDGLREQFDPRLRDQQ